MKGGYRSGSRLGAGFLALALNLASAAPAAALLCSTADPAVVPGGRVVNSIASDTINSILGLTATPPFLTGSTSYTLTNSQPFLAARTFVYDPSQPQAGSVGSFLLPLAHRVICLDRGRIAAQGTAAELRADPRVATAYFGLAPATPAAVAP